MTSKKRRLLAALLSACFAASIHGLSWAQTCTHPPCGTAKQQGQCPVCSQSPELQRAGHPNEVSRLAMLSSSRGYAGYFVGGSTPFLRKGDRRSVDQGVWGWDYWGTHFKRHVALNWLNGRDAKRRFGQYSTDGPRFTEQLHRRRGE